MSMLCRPDRNRDGLTLIPTTRYPVQARMELGLPGARTAAALKTLRVCPYERGGGIHREHLEADIPAHDRRSVFMAARCSRCRGARAGDAMLVMVDDAARLRASRCAGRPLC
jgi:hypothetical protein